VPVSSLQSKLACIPLFACAGALLYFGTGMLFFVPGNPGYESSLRGYLESLFAGRFFYGTLPALLGAISLIIVGWLWDRPKGSINRRNSIKKAFAWAGGAVLLFWISLIIVAGFRDQFR
jgi:hypothetical protein